MDLVDDLLGPVEAVGLLVADREQLFYARVDPATRTATTTMLTTMINKQQQ